MSRVKKSTEKATEKKPVNAAKAAEVAAVKTETTDTKTEDSANVETSAKTEPSVKTEVATTEEQKATKTSKASKAVEKSSKTITKSVAKAEKPAKETKATEKAAKSAPTEKIVLQMDGREDLAMNVLIDRVKAAYVAEGHKADTIKNIEVYIKLSENMAYYVIDGYASGISLN